MRDTECLCGRSRGGSAARGKNFHTADGGQNDRQIESVPEKIKPRINRADIAQHPRFEGQTIKRQPVAFQRGFGFGGPDNIIPMLLIEFLAGFLDDFVQGHEIKRNSADMGAGFGRLFGAHGPDDLPAFYGFYGGKSGPSARRLPSLKCAAFCSAALRQRM